MVKIMKKLVSRSEFAKLAGVSPGAVTKACKKNLAPATIGKRIDCGHPAAVKYLQRSDGTTTANGWTAHNEAKKTKALEKLEASGINYSKMSLSQAVTAFGTNIGFSDFLRARKLIEDINEKRLKNAQTRGELVSRELVKTGLIDPINSAMQRLLTDGAKTMARRVTEMNIAGRAVEDCEKFIVDQISAFIRAAKSDCKKRLQKNDGK